MDRQSQLEEVSVSSSSESREMYGSYWDELKDAPSYPSTGNNGLEGRQGRGSFHEGIKGMGLHQSTTPASRYYSVEDYRSSEDGNASDEDYTYEQVATRKRYFHGQLADAMKRSIWWSATGIVISDLTKSYHMIPITRAVYNASILFFSLFADLVAESTTMSNLLSITTFARTHMWIVMLPSSYIFLNTYLGWRGLFMSFVIMIIAWDGCMDAMANTADLIYKGVDRLSEQYNIVITEEMQGKMANTYQLVFDLSFTCLVVPLALLAYFLRKFTDFSDLLLLSVVMGGAFLLLSLYSLCNYYYGLKSNLHLGSFISHEMMEITFNSIVDEIFNKLDDIREGMRLACLQTYLMKHIIFLAMETAFEQTMISVIIPIIALVTPQLSEKGLLTSNLFSVLLVAIGKIGGSIYGQYVAFKGRTVVRNANGTNRRYNYVQRCMLLSCGSLLLLPLSLYLGSTFPSMSYSRMTITALGIFLFFAFSAYPKYVLASSMHVTIMSHPLSYKIFDFVGEFLTLMDICVVFAISVFMHKIEGKYSVESATFSITLFYLLHCLYHLGNGIGISEVEAETNFI